MYREPRHDVVQLLSLLLKTGPTETRGVDRLPGFNGLRKIEKSAL